MTTQLERIGSYLPPGGDLLPKWLLFISIVSIGNSISSYMSLAGPKEVYSVTTSDSSGTAARQQSVPAGIPASTLSNSHGSSPVNALSARTFGTWTAITSIVRLYAAYNIHDPVVYDLALWTFGIAWAHFASEWLIFGTAQWGRGLAGPVFVATGTGLWMLLQKSHYVQ